MKTLSQYKAELAVLLLLAAAASQAAIPADVSTGIAAQVTDLLALIALVGLARFGVAGAGVIWNVGVRFIKRLGGSA